MEPPEQSTNHGPVVELSNSISTDAQRVRLLFAQEGVRALIIDHFFQCSVQDELGRFFLDSAKASRLRALTLHGLFVEDGILGVLQQSHLPLLHELDLQECARFSAPALARFFSCARLESLAVLNLALTRVDSAGLAAISQKLEHLTDLNLAYCNALAPSGFRELFRSGLPLVNLRLQGIQFADEVVLEFANSALARTLLRLSLKSCSRITDAAFRQLAPRLEALEYLDLSQTGLSAESVASLAERPDSRLRHFKMYECYSMHERAVQSLLDSAPLFRSLQYLDLSWSAISDAQLQQLNGTPNVLLELSISRCAHLTENAFEGFLENAALWGALQSLLVGFNRITEAQFSRILERVQSRQLHLTQILCHACPNLTEPFRHRLRAESQKAEGLMILL